MDLYSHCFTSTRLSTQTNADLPACIREIEQVMYCSSGVVVDLPICFYEMLSIFDFSCAMAEI